MRFCQRILSIQIGGGGTEVQMGHRHHSDFIYNIKFTESRDKKKRKDV